MPDNSVTVVLSQALMNLFPDADREVTLVAGNVGEMIDALNRRWPGMRDRICDSHPAVRRHINVFVAGKRAGLDTPVAHGSRIYILTAISGG